MILGAGGDIELDGVKTALGSIAAKSALGTSISGFFNLTLKEAREQFEKSYLEYHFEKNRRQCG